MKTIATHIISAVWAMIAVATACAQKAPHVAMTPPMGITVGSAAGTSEKDVLRAAKAVVSSGMRDKGYVYVCLADGWAGGRDSLEFLKCDVRRFPHGMKHIADQLHALGLKLGLHISAGFDSVATLPGSLGHEYQDAMTMAQWGVDMLQYDLSNTGILDPVGACTLMRDALASTHRPVVLSIEGTSGKTPWLWAKELAHMWRTTPPAAASGDALDYIFQAAHIQEPLRKYTGPARWNNPGPLPAMPKMSAAETQTQLTMWCMLAAPLITSCDVSRMSKATRNLLTNSGVIAVDQDTLGVAGLKASCNDSTEIWFRPLSGGDWAVTVFNKSDKRTDITVAWASLSFSDPLSRSEADFGKTTYSYVNLWNGLQKGTTATPLKTSLPPHGSLLLRLSPAAATASE